MNSPVLTYQERIKIIEAISKYEGSYTACNLDTEFKGNFVSYAGLFHIGLSYGFLQFTQDSGNLGKLLNKMVKADQNKFQTVFGTSWKELLQTTCAGINLTDNPHIPQTMGHKDLWDKKLWRAEVHGPRSLRCQPVKIENTPTAPAKDLWEEPWPTRFKMAGKHLPFQKCQIELALEDFFKPAILYAKKYGFTTSRQIAIVFDRFVNDGSPWRINKAMADIGYKAGGVPASDVFFRCVDMLSPQKPNEAFIRTRLKSILADPIFSDVPYDPTTF